MTQNRQFGPEFPEHRIITRHSLPGGRTAAETCGNDMRQRGKSDKRSSVFRNFTFRAVGKLFDAMINPHGELSVADRTNPVSRDGPCRLPLYFTIAMPVEMVFTLLRKKLDGLPKGG